MSSTYTIDAANNMVHKTQTGRISVEEEIAFLDKVFSDPQFRPGMNALCDLSQAIADWSLNDLDRFRTYVEKRKKALGECKWALVCTGGITHLTARIFILLHEAFSDTIQIKLFGSRETAAAWLTEAKSPAISEVTD